MFRAKTPFSNSPGIACTRPKSVHVSGTSLARAGKKCLVREDIDSMTNIRKNRSFRLSDNNKTKKRNQS